jgi:hypothetical protein
VGTLYNSKRCFVFTYKDIAEAKGTTIETVWTDASNKRFNPEDIGSVARYVNKGMMRELLQTLKFFKEEGKK